MEKEEDGLGAVYVGLGGPHNSGGNGTAAMGAHNLGGDGTAPMSVGSGVAPNLSSTYMTWRRDGQSSVAAIVFSDCRCASVYFVRRFNLIQRREDVIGIATST